MCAWISSTRRLKPSICRETWAGQEGAGPESLVGAVVAAGAGACRKTERNKLSSMSTRSCTGGGLRSEGLHHLFAGLDIGPADQVDAVGGCGKNAGDERLAILVLQAFERFADRLRLAGQVDDQRTLAYHRDLPRKDRRGHELEADPAHLLAEARHDLVRDGERRLGRDVAGRGPGAPGGQHQMALLAVDELDQCGLDHRPLVRDEALLRAPRTDHDAGEPLLERRNPFILVYAARSSVADRHEPD